MLRGLFYNTAPLGMGHLMRSLYLCKELTKYFQIDLILGSPAHLRLPDLPHFSVIRLPPIIQEKSNGLLQDASGTLSIEEIMRQRKEAIERFDPVPYDFFIAEHFPFGRMAFAEEILLIINKLKMLNSRCLITSSFRGEKNVPPRLVPWVDLVLKELFDIIFIHTDPKVNPCQPILNMFSASKSKFNFTGFVSDPFFQEKPEPKKKQIVVSMGAGVYGEELIFALLKTALLLNEYQWIFIRGPKMAQELAEAFRQAGGKNITIIDFAPNFLTLLSQSLLSISFGGAGTFVDLLQVRIPAIIYPHPSQQDQIDRAAQFHRPPLFKVLSLDDFEPQRLKQIILKTIDTSFPSHNINIHGAKNTATTLFAMLASTNYN